MIERHDDESVAVLTLRHGKANALDIELIEAIVATLLDLETEGKAVVLTGDGPIFSAGVDLFRLVDGGEAYIRPFLDRLDELVRVAFGYAHPMVTAVNGHALAGGFVIAQLGDLTIVADGSARLGLPELSVGVPFPPTVMEALRHRMPTAALEWLTLSALPIGPHEALSLGVVAEVVAPESLVERAVERAKRLGTIDSALFSFTKAQLRGAALDRMDEPELAAEVVDWWCRPESGGAIGRYVEALRRVDGRPPGSSQ